MKQTTSKKVDKNTPNDIATNKAIQSMVGVVVSNKMDKTIIVKVVRKVPHPKYKKYIKAQTKLYANDIDNIANEGDEVVVESCKPISKSKCWKLVKVIKQAKSNETEVADL